jgi:predicted cupin superfamily sugar epimerase
LLDTDLAQFRFGQAYSPDFYAFRTAPIIAITCRNGHKEGTYIFMNEAKDWIRQLGLSSHPEGGYFRETYRSADLLRHSGLPSRYNSDRISATGIYFFLGAGDVSKFHRLRSDEVWCYHAGRPLMVYIIEPDGSLQRFVLGIDLGKQQRPQIVIPHGVWFGACGVEAESEADAETQTQSALYTLVSCMVAPGFEFEDFELAAREDLLAAYPQHKDLIEQLTYQRSAVIPS